jgi:hypothetical protein
MPLMTFGSLKPVFGIWFEGLAVVLDRRNAPNDLRVTETQLAQFRFQTVLLRSKCP